MRRAASSLRSRGVLGLCLSTASRCYAAAEPAASFCSANDGHLPFTLLSKAQTAPDSWLLRFALPPPRRYLGEDPALPTCIKVAFPDGTDEAGAPKVLEKSYSPVSHPATEGEVELLVKGYAPRPGGGVGAYLCGLEVGDVIDAQLKSKRMMHGDAAVLRRWKRIGLVGGGTGVAPLLQIVRIVLAADDEDAHVSLLSINRHEADILMRDELDRLAAAHPGRLSVSYSLTAAPPSGWAGHTGRGSLEMISQALPPPTNDGTTMVLVCGTDGFVETWAGPVARGPRLADGSKGPKVQGPLLGLLAAAGYDASEVFKY